MNSFFAIYKTVFLDNFKALVHYQIYLRTILIKKKTFPEFSKIIIFRMKMTIKKNPQINTHARFLQHLHQTNPSLF